jgi:hypothetical protein
MNDSNNYALVCYGEETAEIAKTSLNHLLGVINLYQKEFFPKEKFLCISGLLPNPIECLGLKENTLCYAFISREVLDERK